MIEKRDIINGIFIAGFPVYGIGSYVSASTSPSSGYLVSLAPFLAILVFYVVDLLYRQSFTIKVNAWYLLMVLFLVYSSASLFISLYKNLPETTLGITLTKSLLLIIPFHAFIAVQLYNDSMQTLVRLTFISLSLLLLINLLGYFALGLTNELHDIEGRFSFPFIDGLYSGACLLAILNLMLLYYFKEAQSNPLWLAAWTAYFFSNLYLLFHINSRLTNLVFLLVVILLLSKVIGRLRLIFWVSLFTIPILLSTGLLLYQIVSLPVFTSILQRVDLIDVVTFNGRAFLWQDAIDWLLYDHRGLFFGNGHRGHYFLNLVSDVAELWNEKNTHHLHLHSTSLEILVGQGVFGFVIFMALFYKVFQYYRKNFLLKTSEAALFPAVVFLLLVFQVDTFLYMENLGGVIFVWLASFTAMRNASSKIKQSEQRSTR